MAHIPHPAHLGFLVDLARPPHHRDDDLITGQYADANSEPLGEVILEDLSPPRRFLLVVRDDVAAMHVATALEKDRRVAAAARRAVLRYRGDESVPPGVLRDGEAWDAGDYVAYTFASEDEARSAQRFPPAGEPG